MPSLAVPDQSDVVLSERIKFRRERRSPPD